MSMNVVSGNVNANVTIPSTKLTTNIVTGQSANNTVTLFTVPASHRYIVTYIHAQHSSSSASSSVSYVSANGTKVMDLQSISAGGIAQGDFCADYQTGILLTAGQTLTVTSDTNGVGRCCAVYIDETV